MQLSILIPVFNEVQYLKIFTDNLNKSFKTEETEFIFINDGSTDGSREWLTEYVNQKSSTNYKLVNFNNNQGKGSALHAGLKICTGNYILFQDSDLELDTDDSYEMFQIIK